VSGSLLISLSCQIFIAALPLNPSNGFSRGFGSKGASVVEALATDRTRMQVESIQPTIYRKDYPQSQSIVAATLFQNEIALIVIRDENGDLQVSALRVHMNTTSANGTFQSRPNVELLGKSLPLSQYPNSISIVRQSDGSTYGIICAAESSFKHHSEFPASGVLSLSAIFKLYDTQGLLRVENHADYWPLDQTGESKFLMKVFG
jgi:hypothetical protein